jgi:hypothetical protein
MKKLFEQLLRFGGGGCILLWVSEFDEAHVKSPFEDLSHQLAERVLGLAREVSKLRFTNGDLDLL